MPFLRAIVKVLIACFCVWHMTAIGIYSLYHVEGIPLLEWLDRQRKYVRPYALITSQWQRWNLFSPDPLRRVIEFHFEKHAHGDVWETVFVLNEQNVSWFQRAPELKLMRRMEEEDLDPLRARYTHDLCRRMAIPIGTPMRIRKRYFVIPKDGNLSSPSFWKSWEPHWKDMILTETLCAPTA